MRDSGRPADSVNPVLRVTPTTDGLVRSVGRTRNNKHHDCVYGELC